MKKRIISPTAEIINIGDEILIGQINNTNAQWLAKQLYALGLQTRLIRVIADQPEDIKKTLESTEADFIVVTGGLGPTLDDLTKQTITEFFNDQLIFHPEIETHIKQMFAKMNYPYTDNNKGQSYLPSKAQILWNHYGTAPGMWIERENKVFVFLPGVPFEMKQIFEQEVVPKIKEKYHLPVLYHKTVTVFGIGESLLADKIKEWEKQLPESVSLAYLPHPGRIRLRLSAKGDHLESLKKTVHNQIDKLKHYTGDLSLSEQVEDLALAVHKKFSETGKSLAFAESCTGGLLVSDLAQIPGASRFLKGGIVAYHTEVKKDVLHVPESIIRKYSVVHEEIVKIMALNIRKMMKADFGVATTGNAGPSKGDSDAPLGTCIIAIATDKGVEAFRFLHGQPREKAVKRTVSKTYEILLKN